MVGQYLTTIKRNEQAVQGMPMGKLNDLDIRVKHLEQNPTSSAWGTITGTLSDQTDLQGALDAKWNNDGTSTATGNWDIGTNIMQATEFRTSDDSLYTPPTQPNAWFVKRLSNTTSTTLLGNTDASANSSGDLVFINDATDVNTATHIYDFGFNSNNGDTSHQTFLYPFPTPSTCDFVSTVTDIYSVAHGLNLNQVLQFAGTLPPEFSLATNYYVVAITDADHFQVSATYGGGAITPSVSEAGVAWAIFGADLSGAYNLGITTPQTLNITTSGGDTVSATFNLSSVQVTWTTGLTVSATDVVSGDFPFSGITGGSTGYQYNTDGKTVYINASNKSFDWLVNGFSSANKQMSLDLNALWVQNIPLNAVNLKKSFGATFDGLGGVVPINNYVSVIIPYKCKITDWVIHSYSNSSGADVVANCVVDIKKYGGGSIIGGGNKPTLISASLVAKPAIGWGSALVNAGQELLFYVVSATVATKVTVTINANLTV